MTEIFQEEYGEQFEISYSDIDDTAQIEQVRYNMQEEEASRNYSGQNLVVHYERSDNGQSDNRVNGE